MPSLRRVLVVLGVTAAMTIPFADAFARGGGGGGRGGGGGGGRGGGGGGGGRGGGGGGGNQMPQQPTESPTITQDKQQITTYTTALNVANTNYTTEVQKFTVTYQKQPDYMAAIKAVDEANKALDAAHSAVVAKLKVSSPEYKAAVAKEAAAQKKLDQIRASGGNRDAISAQSTEIMNAGDAYGKLEKTAQETDPTYVDAKKKLADATAVLKDLKDKLAQQIKDDPNLSSLKTIVDTANTSLTEARKKLSTDLAAGA